MRVEDFQSKKLEDYKNFYNEEELEEVKALADKLKGLSLTHVNSTSFGGGVAEILYNLVPLMRDIGIKAYWEVIEGEARFFTITKKIHNALQGAEITLSEEEKESYVKVNKFNAEEVLSINTDVVIVHDPQPLPIRVFYSNGRKWIWRCHIDLSAPNKLVWKFISKFLEKYDASIFHMKEYIHPDTPTPRKYVMPPSIDPLSPKNMELKWSDVEKILNRFGVDPDKPILLQVARFDPWKDPFAAIDVYRLVKRYFPETQLLLVSSMATDDPEGWEYFEKTARYAGLDEKIFLLTNLKGVGALEVNAFQRAATVVLQMSKREGFGLSVTEALWKKKPVVARPSGGIKLQVIDGETGYLVETVEEAYKRVVYLIKHPEIRDKMGIEGHKHVLKNFTIITHLKNYMHILLDLMQSEL